MRTFGMAMQSSGKQHRFPLRHACNVDGISVESQIILLSIFLSFLESNVTFVKYLFVSLKSYCGYLEKFVFKCSKFLRVYG